MFATAPNKRTHIKGPYLHWKGENELQFIYLGLDLVESFQVTVGAGSQLEVPGQLNDRHIRYRIQRNPLAPAAEQQGIGKILVLGDLHGMYPKLLSYLQQNKVIDEEGHWSWGKGHLVMSGDILDRGEEVTETLWFVYHLEQEAAAAGGAVHYLLGNHELMVMEGDLRYVYPRYLKLFRQAKLSYEDQFSKDAVFGQWMRSRNSAIRLNELLITHAGISPMVAEQGLSLPDINNRMKQYLQQDQKDNLTQLLASQQGPLWYRGYFMPGMEYDTISQDEVAQVLQQYEVAHMVVAHTTVDAVQARYDGKVYAVDLDINNEYIPLEGLLYEQGKFFRLKNDATAVKL